jgi:hypothetical protein
VLIPALSAKARAKGDPASAMLFRALVDAEKDVLIAAPSFAELLRGQPPTHPPRTQYVQVVAFDARAAEIVGREFPPDALLTLSKKLGGPLQYIKFDTMIVACARRYGAQHVVSTDQGVRALASRIGLTARVPSDYLHPQVDLPYPSTPK